MSTWSLLRPELLAAFLPLAWLAWSRRSGLHPITTGIRWVLALLIAIALAGPHLRTGSSTRHLSIVVDRSASMPGGSDVSAAEFIELALAEREAGDELHVVTFGEDSAIEPGLTAASRGFQTFTRAVGPDGSDLSAGLETALSLIPRDARGSITVLSDGFADSPAAVEALVFSAASRGIRIDVRQMDRAQVSDTSVERIELPEDVHTGEPFFVTAWFHADVPVKREVRLLHGGDVVERRVVDFRAGRTRLRFRQRLIQAGIGEYRVTIAALEGATAADQRDRTPENDSALAAVRVRGAKAVLIVNHDGKAGSLTTLLRAAGIPAVPIAAEQAPRDLVTLEAFRAVVLQNVSAARVGLERMHVLADWVRHHGGGLMMTGGEASFASGGYYKSPLDELLPVSLEQRQEHRKLAVALSVTLDRSGSMSAPAGNGTKMDLANRGTVEALRLLSPRDSASVIAVDSSPHVILQQANVMDLPKMEERVLGIRSQGGGIFTATALRASAVQLKDAPQTTKHVILFADAADAEEQTDTPAEIKLLRAMGATVSVIGLGSTRDSDADFLKDCARRGGGEAYFTTSPSELPRLFAMDTQAVARSTFVIEPTAIHSRPELFGLGEMGRTPFPTIAGYNLCYIRPGASLGAVTLDEYAAPLFAFQGHGLGRVAVYTGQIGGSHGASLTAWEGFPSFFVTVCRWLGGIEEPAGVFASAMRDGRDAILSVEFDENYDRTALGEALSATLSSGTGPPRTIALERKSETHFEARIPLAADTIAFATVALQSEDSEAGTGLSLPPLALPYSPEYERAPDASAGAQLLRSMARRSGGITNVSAPQLFRGDRGVRTWRLFTRELLVCALILFLIEIAGRRLSLWGALRLPARTVAQDTRTKSSSTSSKPSKVSAQPAKQSQAQSGPDPKPAEAQVEAPNLSDALSRARRSADDRLDR